MNTNHHVQHNQMQPDLVFKLMNFEVRESSSFLERGQINDQFQNGSAALTLRVGSPKLRKNRSSDRPNDGSSIPVVLVEKSAEGAWTFDGRMFGSGIAVSFQERGDQRIEGLELMAGGDEGLDGVEYGSGFFVQRTISLLVGT